MASRVGVRGVSDHGTHKAIYLPDAARDRTDFPTDCRREFVAGERQ
jgi:hypothetical protein